jgi:hypothetical protein
MRKQWLYCHQEIGYDLLPNYTKNCTYLVEASDEEGYTVVNDNGKTRKIPIDCVGSGKDFSLRTKRKLIYS